MALEVILRLDVAQELRLLSTDERDLRKHLKRKVVALAIMECARNRQSSRITNLKDGDAITRFLHLRANHRRRKNFIDRLKHNNEWVTAHDHKKAIIQDHFAKVTKHSLPRRTDFNWDNIPVPECDLTGLGVAFIEKR